MVEKRSAYQTRIPRLEATNSWYMEVTVQQTDTGYFPVKTGEKTIFVPMDKITFFYAKVNHVYVHDTEDHKYLTDYTLTDLEEKLPPQFVCIHRSTL